MCVFGNVNVYVWRKDEYIFYVIWKNEVFSKNVTMVYNENMVLMKMFMFMVKKYKMCV